MHLRAGEVIVLDGRTVIATHERSGSKGVQVLDLDHYLEVLKYKPGALPGATASVQARACGASTSAHEAAKLNADEPEFGIWKAWVEFLLAQDHKRQRAASTAAIEAALKKVPRCMPGYLFLGQMAKLAGELDLAERHLKRGLALDPQHAEIVRELKYLRK